MAGIAIGTLYAFHGKRLHPTKNSSGYWVYDHDEVVEFAKWYQKTRPRFKKRFLTDGEKCGKAFSLFEAGYTVSGVVIAVDVEVERVEKWYAQWQIDQQNLARGADLKDVVQATELETKKTKLQIARETLAIVRNKRDRTERRANRRDRSEEGDLPIPPEAVETPLTNIFAEAAGLKKS